MNNRKNFFRLILICVCLAGSPAFGQVAGKSFEPGVFRGLLFNDSPLLVAIDESQKIGYASIRATLACIEEVRVFIGSGNGSLESPVSLTATIDAVCPDKSVRSFDIRMEYDAVSDTMELSYPEFPSWPSATLGRVAFNPNVFTDAIQDMKNDATWLLQDLFARTDDQQCADGDVVTGVLGGDFQCSPGEPGPAGPTGPRGPSGPPGPAGEGLPLSCAEGQSVVWNGIDWTCADATGVSAGGTACTSQDLNFGILDDGAIGLELDAPYDSMCGGGAILEQSTDPVRSEQFHSGSSTPVVEDVVFSGPIADREGRLASAEATSMSLDSDGLTSFFARRIVIDPLLMPAIHIDSETGTTKIPGPANAPSMLVEGLVSAGSGTEAADWWQNVVDGQSDRRSVSVYVLDRSAATIGQYAFANCMPTSYHSQPFGVDYLGNTQFRETLRLQCDALSDIWSDIRPAMAGWIHSFVTGSGVPTSVGVEFYGRDGFPVQTQTFTGAFPVEYHFPSFDASEADPVFRETVVINANGILIE